MSAETIPSNAQPEFTPEPQPLHPEGDSTASFSVPEKYREKEYLNGVDNIDKVYDMLDNAQSLIGKRPAGIPQENASQEEWNSFYKEMGRPDSADGYEFESVELPEGHQTDEAFMSESNKIMHEMGLNNSQAQKLKKWYDDYTMKVIGSQSESQEKLDQEFNELASKHFGSEQDKVISNAKILLADNVPDGFKEGLSKLNNNDLMLMAGVLNNIQKKYINEDSLANKTETAQLSPNKAEMQKKGRELMSNPAYRDKGHFNHKKIKNEVDAIYANLPSD